MNVSAYEDLLSPGADDVLMEELSDIESDPVCSMDDIDEPLTPDSGSGCQSENGDMQDPDQDQDTSDRMIRCAIVACGGFNYEL